MGTTLAENIRRYRKERKLTQEQLSEVLGVTAGAVYKWEAGLSVPELDMLVSLADFFDSSVDALLGHRMNESSLKASLENIGQLTQSRDPEAITQTEVMLRKYPNSFEAVMNAANVYQIYGNGSRDEKRLRRSQELLEHALVLLPQNTDPEISEQIIYGMMADNYIMLGEKEKGIELLKQHNGGAVFSYLIGLSLAMYLERYEEAVPYLSSGLLLSLSEMINSAVGFVCVYLAKNDYLQAEEIMRWAIDAVSGIKKEGTPDGLDRIYSYLMLFLSCAQKMQGKTDEARSGMEKAYRIVAELSNAPDYGVGTMKFIYLEHRIQVIDSFGETAAEGAEMILDRFGDDEMKQIWEEIRSNG